MNEIPQQEQQQPQPPLLTIDGEAVSDAVPFSVDSAYIANFDKSTLVAALHAQLMRGRGGGSASVYEHLAASNAFIDRDDPSMTYRGRPIKRTKFFAVRGANGVDDGASSVNHNLAHLPADTPLYKYPGFQYEIVEQYVNLRSMPFINALVEQLEQRAAYKGVPITINHVIGTHYITGEDNIGFHSDKTEDIQADSPILMFSFGGRRELWFSKAVVVGDKAEKDGSGETGDMNEKGDTGEKDEKSTAAEKSNGEQSTAADAEKKSAAAAAEEPEIVAKFIMEPGSLFVLGPETNRLLKHSIVPESDETCIDREKEPLQPRISLVARHISTVLSRRELRRRIDKSVRDKALRAAAKQRKEQQRKQEQQQGQQQEEKAAEPRSTNGTGQKRKRQGERSPQRVENEF